MKKSLSVRKIAKISGVPPATVHRAISTGSMNLETAKKLLESGFIDCCPCCGKHNVKQIVRILHGN